MKINKWLETQMVKYTDLLTVQSKECGEPLVSIRNIPNAYLPTKSDMIKQFGEAIIVRKSINDRLTKAQYILKRGNKNYSLFVTYGYRTLAIQTKRFLDRLTIIGAGEFYPCANDLYEEVHRSVAVPTVGGHPTGGAVDIYIIDLRTNLPLDFGSEIYDYSTKKYYVFSQDISSKQKRNRKILRSTMMKAGFAPFDGEWWHFSYGDKEWAFYYKMRFSIFSPI